jgi:hypothetical protein
MAIQRAVLLIADIGGYTNYMQWNRMHLAHAQRTVADLLESVIDAGKGLKLAKLEGDAAFFWAPEGNAKVLVCERLSDMRRSFLMRREKIKTAVACDCASCAQLDSLSLKFVAHEGEVAPEMPEHSFGSRLATKLKFESTTLPYVLGIKKACVGFRHLGRARQAPVA